MKNLTRKVVTGLFMVALLLVIAGCARDGNDPAAPPGGTAGAGLSPVTLSVAFWDNGMWEINPADTMFGTYIHERFNITVEPMVITWGDFNERLQMWAAAGQLPDVFLNFWYWQWRSDGLTKPLNLAYLEANYPNLMDRISATAIPFLTVDGYIYGLPRTSWRNSSIPVSATGLYINTRFLEMAGLDTPPTTLDGWVDFLRQAVNDDFSGMNTLGLSSDGGVPSPLLTVLPFTGSSGRFVQEDGQWTLTQLARSNIEALRFGRMLYQEGIIDSQIATRRSGDAMNLFNEGRLVLMQSNTDGDMMARFRGPDNLDTYQWVTFSMGPESFAGEGRFHNAISNFDGNISFNSAISQEKLDRALMFFDWAASPEGERIATLGFEGTHWEMQNDRIVSLIPDIDGAGQKYWEYEAFAMFARFMISWNFEYAITSPVHPPGNLAMANEHLDNIRNTARIVDINWGLEFFNSPAIEAMPAIGPEWTALYLQAIAGTEDVEVMFERYLQQQLVRFQDAIDELNEFARSQGY